MSRLAKKPIKIPSGTEVRFAENNLLVKGPLGELIKKVPVGIGFDIQNDEVFVTISPDFENRALQGTFVAHLKNMISGVNKAFEKKLIVEGVGFKADVKGDELVLNVGFSHQVKMQIPQDIKIVVDNKNGITLTSIDKELLGDFTATVRSVKKPEPYKGKGIRYSDEVIRRKQGKKTA